MEVTSLVYSHFFTLTIMMRIRVKIRITKSEGKGIQRPGTGMHLLMKEFRV